MSESELPLVSIVTPAYNQAAFLPDTIETVLSQDYPRIEHIVIDDGSTDNTREILSSYTGRLTWESQPNQGQTPTINKGWQRSSGEIITWLNSDDTYLPGAVSKAVEYLQQHPDIDIVYGDTLLTEADGTPIETMKAPEFSYRALVANCHNPIPQPSAFIRRKVMEDVGLLDPHYYYFMDWDFWLRAGIRHSFAYFPELLSTYRLHEESKTVAQAVRAAPELEYMYRKFFALPDLPDNIRRLEKEAMMNMFFTTGGYYLNGGDRKAARQMARKALQARPATVVFPGVAHKFLYCFFGGQPFYQNSKKAYHKLKTGLSNP
jgi:glycosyltransferase involved in cell wall biosynthesis